MQHGYAFILGCLRNSDSQLCETFQLAKLRDWDFFPKIRRTNFHNCVKACDEDDNVYELSHNYNTRADNKMVLLIYCKIQLLLLFDVINVTIQLFLTSISRSISYQQ
jgi:hypothetical protein